MRLRRDAPLATCARGRLARDGGVGQGRLEALRGQGRRARRRLLRRRQARPRASRSRRRASRRSGRPPGSPWRRSCSGAIASGRGWRSAPCWRTPGPACPFYAVLGITVGNTLEALAGAYLLREVADFRPSLERVRDVLALAVLGGHREHHDQRHHRGHQPAGRQRDRVRATSAPCGAPGGSATWAATSWSPRRCWSRPPTGPTGGRPDGCSEAVALVAAVLGVSALVFSQSDGPHLPRASRFWSGRRCGSGSRAPSAAILLVASVAIPLTENDLGPFSGRRSRRQAAPRAGVPGRSPASPALVLAAVITERRRAEEAAE